MFCVCEKHLGRVRNFILCKMGQNRDNESIHSQEVRAVIYLCVNPYSGASTIVVRGKGSWKYLEIHLGNTLQEKEQDEVLN